MELLLGIDILITYEFVLDFRKDTINPGEKAISTTTYNMIDEVLEETYRRRSLLLMKKRRNFMDRELPLFEQIKGTIPLVKHRMELLNQKAIKQRYRPRNPKMQEIVNNKVDKMSEKKENTVSYRLSKDR